MQAALDRTRSPTRLLAASLRSAALPGLAAAAATPSPSRPTSRASSSPI